MRHLPVHWSEGMFLRPQHFQANDRHHDERGVLGILARDPCSYGICKLEIDPTALANRQIEIRSCRAVLKDGTLVWLEPGEEPGRLSLERAAPSVAKLQAALGEALAVVDTVTVYLGVPRFDPVSANVAPPGPAERSRFTAVRQPLQDQSTGGNDQDVEFLRLNCRILLSTQDLSGYEVLPIAQVRRTGNREAAPEIDPEYFPPSLAIDAWDPLGRDIVRAIYDLLGRKIEVLAEQAVNRQVGFSSSEPGDIDRLVLLSKAIEAQATLRVIAFAPGIHPRTAYLELCRIAGQLAVFEPERRLGDLPAYDHDDLARIFRDVRDRIERMLSRVATLAYEQRYFIGTGPATMGVSLEAKWLQSDWRWYVGVLRGEMTEEECRILLTRAKDGAAQLDWVLGSAGQVDQLFKMGIPGLQLIPVDRPPQALPQKGGWVYYQIGRESVAWNGVRDTQTLSVRLRETLLLNKEKLVGSRRLEVSHKGTPAVLEFSLFAVPQTT
jgi:type VI secretion system protein ImpJ